MYGVDAGNLDITLYNDISAVLNSQSYVGNQGQQWNLGTLDVGARMARDYFVRKLVLTFIKIRSTTVSHYMKTLYGIHRVAMGIYVSRTTTSWLFPLCPISIFVELKVRSSWKCKRLLCNTNDAT